MAGQNHSIAMFTPKRLWFAFLLQAATTIQYSTLQVEFVEFGFANGENTGKSPQQ